MKFSRLFIAVAATTAVSGVALVGCQTQGSTGANMVLRNGYVYTVDGHDSVQQAIAVANGKIVYVGSDDGVSPYIDKHTANPGDGKYVRDSAGNLTGICEDGAGDAMAAVVPPATDAEELNQTSAALDAMRQQGITTFFDALSGPENGKAFTALQRSGELTARALPAIKLDPAAAVADPVKTIAEAKALADTYDQGEAKAAPGVNMRHVKLFMDGICPSRGPSCRARPHPGKPSPPSAWARCSAPRPQWCWGCSPRPWLARIFAGMKLRPSSAWAVPA